jgi:hypothetical protein
MKRFSLAELEALPTLHSGQYDNLKVEKGTIRVWLSRMTVGDGAPCNNQVTVEDVQNGRRVTVDEYEAT